MDRTPTPDDLQSQLESLVDLVWKLERRWWTEDRIDLAARVGGVTGGEHEPPARRR